MRDRRRPARYEDPEIPDDALSPTDLSRRLFLKAAGVFGVSAAFGTGALLSTAAAANIQRGPARLEAGSQNAVVTGYVFDDRNGQGQRQPGFPGIADVAVSDGESIAVTDADGRYELVVDPSRRSTGLVFVTTPAGWSAPPDSDMVPTFFRHVTLEPGAEVEADFALQRDQYGHDADYRFLTAADPHVRPAQGFGFPFDPDPLGRRRGQKVQSTQG
jgi:hypothetical protein